MVVDVLGLLQKVYGPRGIPFPQKPLTGSGKAIAPAFPSLTGSKDDLVVDGLGSYIKEYTDEALGRYIFMPVTIDGYKLENPLIIISGEKEIIETDLVEVGTVFEKAFTKPYSISVITTIVGTDKKWPLQKFEEVVKLWKKDDLVTIKSAITNRFLQPEKNMIITNISVLENDGAENVEVIQIDGKSNVDFKLVLL